MLDDLCLNLLLVVPRGFPIAGGAGGGNATPSISVGTDRVGPNVIGKVRGGAGGIAMVVAIPCQAALYCYNLVLDAGSLGYSILAYCVSFVMVSGGNAKLILKGM